MSDEIGPKEAYAMGYTNGMQEGYEEGRANPPGVAEWMEFQDPIRQWFNLTYASYLTLPRSVLQSMPQHWQARLCVLLDELNLACTKAGVELPETKVCVKDARGRFAHDWLADYRRGRRNVFSQDAPSVCSRRMRSMWRYRRARGAVMTHPYCPYAAGYRAGSCASGFAAMPWFLSNAEAGEWLCGFIEAAADGMGTRERRLEPEVVAVMQRAGECG